MTYQVRNVIVGAAALYIGASDSTVGGYSIPALPADPSAGSSFTTALDASANWRHTGFTQDGLEVTYAPDYADIEVDQLLDSAKIFKQSMRVTVNTTLAEAALENLVVAWGQQTAALTSTSSDATLGIAAGALGDEPVERALAAVGNAPKTAAGAKRERVYYARRVLSVESTAHALRRNEATVFPVSFRLLPDTTQPSGQEYGKIRDRNV
jgi:hypothetical protein